MTAQEAKQSAIQARIMAIDELIIAAVNEGKFETQIQSLTDEQKKHLQDNGYKVRYLQQKGPITFDINWDQ